MTAPSIRLLHDNPRLLGSHNNCSLCDTTRYRLGERYTGHVSETRVRGGHLRPRLLLATVSAVSDTSGKQAP